MKVYKGLNSNRCTGDDQKMPEYNPEWIPLNDIDKIENADIFL